jgi:hypothetical protein
MENTLVVLSGTSLAATDAAVVAGNLQIKSSPVIKLSAVNYNNGVENHLNETVRVADFDITAANSTVYALTVTQMGQFGQLLTNYLQYTSLSSGDTATTICNKLVTTFNQQASAMGMGVVASNSSDNLRLTATAATSTTTLGTPLFSASGNTNLPLLTGTSDAMYIAPNGTPATAFIVATLVFTTNAAHGLIPGDTVKVTNWATTVMTYKGATASATDGLIARVATVPSSTTFTLEGLTASGVNSGTLVILKVPQVAMGTPAAVTAAQVAAGQTPSVSTTYNYGRCVIQWVNSGPVVVNPISGNNSLTVYFPNALVASAYTAQNTAFSNQLLATTQGYTVGGTDANPDIIAINQNLTQ